MSRIVSTEGPGKIRSQHRRTIAEALRRLSQKDELDGEAKDLAALIVFSLHGIADSNDRTTDAWEKRNYYLKADEFRQRWRWLEPLTEELSALIYRGLWDQLPAVLARLLPHFADVQVKKMTRNPVFWQGAYDRFMREE